MSSLDPDPQAEPQASEGWGGLRLVNPGPPCPALRASLGLESLDLVTVQGRPEGSRPGADSGEVGVERKNCPFSCELWPSANVATCRRKSQGTGRRRPAQSHALCTQGLRSSAAIHGSPGLSLLFHFVSGPSLNA